MGRLGDSPAWEAAGERAGKGLSAKITDMRGLAGAVPGGWSRGWRGHMPGLPVVWGALHVLLLCWTPWTTVEINKENSLLSLCKLCSR